MKKLFLASCLTVAGLFALQTNEAKADHQHHGHGHYGHAHHGHAQHYGHYGHIHSGYQFAPRYVYRPYSVYQPYPVYRSYPVYQAPYYDYYPSSSLYIGGRNFSFGISGF